MSREMEGAGRCFGGGGIYVRPVDRLTPAKKAETLRHRVLVLSVNDR